MSSKHNLRLARAAVPHLRQGEVVEIGAFTTIGQPFPVRRFLTEGAIGILMGGPFATTARPAKRFLAVTNQRLLFFKGEATFGRPRKFLFGLPREAVAVVKSGRHLLAYRIDLAVAGQEKGLRMSLPITARVSSRARCRHQRRPRPHQAHSARYRPHA